MGEKNSFNMPYVEILMNVTTPFRRKLTTRFGAN
jgi:hypothetical protein